MSFSIHNEMAEPMALKRAILLYGPKHGNLGYATVHEVAPGPDNSPVIKAGKALDRDALASIVTDLSGAARRRHGLLPPNVLAVGNDLVMWWLSPGVRTFYFDTTTQDANNIGKRAGNRKADGQMIVGQAGYSFRPNRGKTPPRLPLVTELLPEIIEGAEDDNTPSCSAAQSILRQGLATNLMGATWAFAWLAEALRHGKIGWHGVFFNLESGRATSIPVDPERWAAMGYQPPQKAKPKRLKKAA